MGNQITLAIDILKRIEEEDYEPVDESYTLAASKIAHKAIDVLKEIELKKEVKLHTHCPKCGKLYDDYYNWIICPHKCIEPDPATPQYNCGNLDIEKNTNCSTTPSSRLKKI